MKISVVLVLLLTFLLLFAVLDKSLDLVERVVGSSTLLLSTPLRRKRNNVTKEIDIDDGLQEQRQQKQQQQRQQRQQQQQQLQLRLQAQNQKQRSLNRQLEIKIEGLGGTPDEDAYPLQLCQGDCDTDDDCDVGLVCHQREKNDPVPGCIGAPSSKTDFCILAENSQQASNNEDNDTGNEPNNANDDGNSGNEPDNDNNTGNGHSTTSTSNIGSTLRLKLYWEDGYTWQDETIERKWCMMYDYDGNPKIGGQCWYGRDRRPCRSDQVYIEKCSNDKRQQFRFERIQGGDEVLIKTAGSGSSSGLCFERQSTEIFLEPCNSNNAKQRWFAIRGFFDDGGDRFEISQRTGDEFSKDQCVTQAHHPKRGEVVEMEICNVARSENHQTSWWNGY